MRYPQLTGKCRLCGGCARLEDINFKGTDNCKYADEPIQQIKRILGVDRNDR